MPQWDTNFRENNANNIVPSRKIYSRSAPAGKIPTPTKIKPNFLSPSYKIRSPVRIRSSHLWKKVFLEISQNSQENTCAKVAGLGKKRDSGTDVFLWILWNLQETFFSQNTSGRLLLKNTPECLIKVLVLPSKKSKHFGFAGDILKIISNPSDFWNNHYWHTKTWVLEYHYGYYVKVHTMPFPK